MARLRKRKRNADRFHTPAETKLLQPSLLSLSLYSLPVILRHTPASPCRIPQDSTHRSTSRRPAVARGSTPSRRNTKVMKTFLGGQLERERFSLRFLAFHACCGKSGLRRARKEGREGRRLKIRLEMAKLGWRARES